MVQGSGSTKGVQGQDTDTAASCAAPDDPDAGGARLAAIARCLQATGRELGFDAVRIAAPDLAAPAQRLQDWLAAGMHGAMDYMAAHVALRADPAALLPGAVRAVMVRLPYWPGDAAPADAVLADGAAAYLSRYALGRDYHKVLRARLQRLAKAVAERCGPWRYRVFTDSAPVMEVELATQCGMGWRGKHTLLLDRHAGSTFFLGGLLTDLPLPVDPPQADHCGTCNRCLEACPTGAIHAPYVVDARRCISYLTIELHGPIPAALRPLIGNRVYGCDDCQLVCPWNRFSRPTAEPDFAVRHGLDRATLVELFSWREADFTARMAGSPLYRIGYERWQRNLAVGLGNAPTSPDVVHALEANIHAASSLVREHVEWALTRHGARTV